MTAALVSGGPRVVALVDDRPRVAHWDGPPPPLRIVPPEVDRATSSPINSPPSPSYRPGRWRTRADYDRHRLRVAVAQIRDKHPKLTEEQATVEALARQRWRELNPGTCVGNGLTLAEHLTAQRVRAERAARRRRPEERNLRAVVRAAVRRRQAASSGPSSGGGSS